MENILASLGALPMFLLMFLVLYFLLIRPQVKEQKERQAMISNLKKNDRIVTTSGLVGKVIEFKGKDDRYIIIDNENGSKIKLIKSSVSSLLDRK